VQIGQHEGRTSSTVGSCCCQRLIPIALWTTLFPLRFTDTGPEHDEEGSPPRPCLLVTYFVAGITPMLHPPIAGLPRRPFPGTRAGSQSFTRSPSTTAHHSLSTGGHKFSVSPPHPPSSNLNRGQSLMPPAPPLRRRHFKIFRIRRTDGHRREPCRSTSTSVSEKGHLYVIGSER
jgi:hypothetical protein